MIDLHTSIMEVPFKHFAVSDRHGLGQQQPHAVAGKGQHSMSSVNLSALHGSHSPLSAALSATLSRTYYIIPSFHVSTLQRAKFHMALHMHMHVLNEIIDQP
jgi:hypothetical protein